jgi:tRNA pseudouridine38-40 synthase
VTESAQNWKLIVAYDGTDFRGWQVQPGQTTVQGELQEALGRVTGESPLPQGSGRTDAGVHALAQVASFPLAAGIPPESLRLALNRTLPESIRVLSAQHVPEDFHARHSTTAKTYEYRVFAERPPENSPRLICPPFLARYVYSFPWPLSLDVLNEAAVLFVGTYDFRSFAATDPDQTSRDQTARGGANAVDEANAVSDAVEDEDGEPQKSAVRTIFGSAWHEQQTADGTMLVYRVRGSGFLHHMVRNLAGTMLDVGRGYTPASAIPGMIAAQARAAAGPTAPARGLFLHSVEYPE